MKPLPAGFLEDYTQMRTLIEWSALGWKKGDELRCVHDYLDELQAFLQRWPRNKLPEPYCGLLLGLGRALIKIERTLQTLFMSDVADLVDLRVDQALAELRLNLLNNQQSTLSNLHETGRGIYLNLLRKNLGTDDFAAAYRDNERKVEEAGSTFREKLARLETEWPARLTEKMRAQLLDPRPEMALDLHGQMIRASVSVPRNVEVNHALDLILALGSPGETILEVFQKKSDAVEKISTPLFPRTELLREAIEKKRIEPEANQPTLLLQLRTVALFELVEARMNHHIGKRLVASNREFLHLMMRSPEALLPKLLEIYMNYNKMPFDPEVDDRERTAADRDLVEKYQKRRADFIAQFGDDFSPLKESTLASEDEEMFLRYFKKVEASYLALQKKYPELPAIAFRRKDSDCGEMC